MKKITTFCVFLLICWITFIGKEIQSQTLPPDSNFKLSDLDIFAPQNPIAPVKEKYGEGILVNRSKGNQVYQFSIRHSTFNFPIVVQVSKENIVDYFCRLPSYFLHDLFLQSLVNKYGKQDIYRREREEALYIWKSKEGKEVVYMATCTITCFPVYLVVIKNGLEKGTPSLLQTMNE